MLTLTGCSSVYDEHTDMHTANADLVEFSHVFPAG
jgi:hypothetical protein